MRYGTAVPVAAGATGRVVRAFDHERGEEVALKLLHRDDPAWVQRMMREAEVQARLDHPGICPVYGTGRLGDQPYIAMRYVAGETLDRAAALLPDRDRAALVAEVADALAHAHGHGVVHRDLKPSNILVERGADGALRPVLVDFGLVREVSAPELTRTGQVLGTPGYMAPEQALAAARVDARADIFSLGVVLFELLAGRRPFTGESAAEILLQTLRAEPPALERLRPDIDPALARIVRQCLETDPAWRYPDAEALRDDLRAFRDGRRVAAPRDTRLRRLHRFTRRHPWRAGLGAAAALSLAAVVAIGAYSFVYARRQSDAAQGYTEFAAGIENAMRLELMKPPHDVAPVREALRARVDAFARALPRSGPAATRAGQLALGRALSAFGEDALARVHFERALAAGEDSPALHAALGRAMMREYFDALQAAATIGNDELRSAAVDALERSHRIAAREHLHIASRADDPTAPQMRALLEWLDGDTAAAERTLAEVAARLPYPVDALLLSADLAAADAVEAGLHGDSGRALGRWREALARYRSASEIARSHAAARAAQCRVGGALVTQARHGAAVPEAEYRDALAQCDIAIALDTRSALAHASKAQAHADLGVLRRARGTWSDADFEPAVAAARTALSLDPGSIAAARALGALLTQRAYWQAENGDVAAAASAEEAITLLEDAQRRDPGSAHGAILVSTARLAAARAAVFTGGEREPHLLAAEQALERVTRGRDAPLVLEVEVIENKTWRGFEAYMAGRDPGRTLHDAVERGQKLHQRAPGHPQVGPALGMAAWTLADYQRLIGEDAEAMARVAVDAYGRTIARESASFADRFNAVGALQLLARERLARGRSAAAELEELARWTALLQARAGGENRIDIQLAANQHLAALQALHESRDAREALAAARRGLERALANPLDAREAALLLAELVAAEHASRRARMEPDDARARADAQALREAVARHADYAALHAAIAEAYVALPAGIVAPAEARELLESALERMPPLRGRYAELARALAAR